MDEQMVFRLEHAMAVPEVRTLVCPSLMHRGVDSMRLSVSGAGCRCLVVDVCRLGGIDDPNASLLDGKGEKGAVGGLQWG